MHRKFYVWHESTDTFMAVAEETFQKVKAEHVPGFINNTIIATNAKRKWHIEVTRYYRTSELFKGAFDRCLEYIQTNLWYGDETDES